MVRKDAAAIKRKFGANCFKRWGRAGGSPILLSYRLKRPVKGYRVTKTTNKG